MEFCVIGEKKGRMELHIVGEEKGGMESYSAGGEEPYQPYGVGGKDA